MTHVISFLQHNATYCDTMQHTPTVPMHVSYRLISNLPCVFVLDMYTHTSAFVMCVCKYVPVCVLYIRTHMWIHTHVSSHMRVAMWAHVCLQVHRHKFTTPRVPWSVPCVFNLQNLFTLYVPTTLKICTFVYPQNSHTSLFDGNRMFECLHQSKLYTMTILVAFQEALR